jgi:4-hydroxybutyrate CoA-transferase
MSIHDLDNKNKYSAALMKTYRSKVVSAAEAVEVIQSGDRVAVHSNTAFPHTLIDAMVARKDELEGVILNHALSVGDLPYFAPGMEKHFRHESFFMGAQARQAVNDGRADFIPIYLFEYPILHRLGRIKTDVALVNVSPPDEHGFCSLGVEVGLIKTPAERATTVVAQVNPRMPRALGDSFIHINKIDYIVEVEEEVDELPQHREGISDEQMKVYDQIGKNVAEMIEDGSTLQMGIGVIPDSVLKYLSDKKDLGIHSEMFSDGTVDLVQRGVITNREKGLHAGKIIVGFVLGTRALYDFIDNNPLIEFHPQEYVNDPFVIAQNKKMVAINSAVEVDITGQVCSDSIGPRLYSGFGGQVDFIRGATRSEGGKPIITLPSTTKNDTISRIVATLKPGAGVVTNRADVHYVATEHGVADLFGKPIRHRVREMIKIAHPKFHDELEAYAKKHNYI